MNISHKLAYLAQNLPSSKPRTVGADTKNVQTAIRARSRAIADSVCETIDACNAIEDITTVLLRWMCEETTVRIIGAGRARLAATIPANRLAHGGARVSVQGSMIPMPHTAKGGGIIAVSASGRTPSVLDILRIVRQSAPHITVIGIADWQQTPFADLCSYFIGIREVISPSDTLHALADIKEYVISEVLDAVVVAAGRQGGFDERKWRLGHENLAETGPYDTPLDLALLFNE